ncbi:MAG: type II toxin-antitoxin system RelE/ParE family toxin [Thermomicrobiales bacterium]
MQYTLQTWGEVQHDAYAAAVNDALDEIVRFPAMGRRRDDLRRGTRSFQVREHSMIDLPDDDVVMVLRIVHQRREVVRLEL